MIPDQLQDQAALYALDMLGGAERSVFEEELSGSEELRQLVVELREGAGDLALAIPQRAPSAALRARILSDDVVESNESASAGFGLSQMIPWAIAAALAIYAGYVVYDHGQLEKQVARLQNDQGQLEKQVAELQNADPMANAKLVVLAPSAPAPADAKAIVAWEPKKETGVLKVTGLPAPAAGRDYQLWAVDATHSDPVSAGIVRVDAKGVAEVRFKPTAHTPHVKAFAISLEREGGSEKKEGPILLAGTT
ncbi:MAG: anti-sigma factor [Verrucomicrobiota bacterium]|nr:anti-sigma factor [Verrucomicrobiota bacterium]